jgi:hypothetical protein
MIGMIPLDAQTQALRPLPSDEKSFAFAEDDLGPPLASPLAGHVATFVERDEDLTERETTIMLIHLHVLSRKLRLAPKADKWDLIKKPIRERWRNTTGAWAPQLNDAINLWETEPRTKAGDDALTKVIIQTHFHYPSYEPQGRKQTTRD